MNKKWIKVLFAGCLALAIALPLWAQSTQSAPAMGMSKGMHHMSASSDWVKSVQQALQTKGNDPGPIDGRMGHKTKAAIKAFQKANSLKVTGRVDKETAEKLGVEMK